MSTPTSIDPRIGRTQSHVIGVAREMLTEGDGALTFTTIAHRAQVSRRTLYIHWGSVENLVAETIADLSMGGTEEYEPLDTRGRALLFLARLTELMDTGTSAACAILLAASFHDEGSSVVITKFTAQLSEGFAENVGTVSADEFAQLVSPILLTRIGRAVPATSLIEALADRAVAFIA